MPFSGQPPLRAPVMTMTHGLSPARRRRVPFPGGTVDEVPGSERPLLALDKKQALTGEHEEVLRVRLGVVQVSRPAEREHTQIDSELGKGASSPSKKHAAPKAPFVSHAASPTLTANHPSPAGTSPASVCSSGASGAPSSEHREPVAPVRGSQQASGRWPPMSRARGRHTRTTPRNNRRCSAPASSDPNERGG